MGNVNTVLNQTNSSESSHLTGGDAVTFAAATAAGGAGGAAATPSGTPTGGSSIGTDTSPQLLNNSLSGLLPSSELKWREGNKTEAIPCPSAKGITTYAKLLERPDFKDFLYKHLDSDILISSLLSTNSSEQKVLLEGIQLYQQMEPEKREQALNSISKFQDLVAAGIKIGLPETQCIVEKELDVHNRAESSPFLRAFQRRLAVLINLKDFIAIEQKAAKEQRRPRTFVMTDLTSAKYPQLQILDSLKTTGINLLHLFPVCYPVLSSEDDKKILFHPVEQLCTNLCELADLELFSSWSPAQRPLQVPVKLKVHSAKASEGNATSAIDGKPTAWSAKKTASCFWSVQFEQPCVLSSIKIAWKNTAEIGSPKILCISVVYCHSESDSVVYERLMTIRPDEERIKQGTWDQTYMIPKGREIPVSSIKLSMMRPGASNMCGAIKMHSFKAFATTSNMKWVDTPSLMFSLQEALYPICKKFPFLQMKAYEAILSIVRSVGSLKLALHLILEMISGDFSLNNPPLAIRDLHNLILAENKRVSQRVYSSTDTPLPDVTFDSDSKTALVKISEDGFRITYEHDRGMPLAFTIPTAYCMLSCIMSTGVWVWEFSAIPSTPDIDSLCIGVAKRPIANEDYLVSADYYVVRCLNGELYHDGKVAPPADARATPPRIQASDICRFIFDAEAQTLSMTVNDNYCGVLFSDIPPGVSPVVVFASEGAGAKSRSIRLKQVLRRDLRSVDEECFGALSQELSGLLDQAVERPELNNSSIPLFLLSAISDLSQLRMDELTREETLKEKHALSSNGHGSILEHPLSVEVSADVISLLVSLLQSRLNRSVDGLLNAADKNAVISILRILDCQFYCLTKSGVDPETLGFTDQPSEVSTNASKDGVAKHAAKIILALTDSPDQCIQLEASKVYARGAVLFLRTVIEKVDLVLCLIRSNGAIDSDTSKFLILAMIIKHLSNIDDVLEIFSFLKTKGRGFEESIVSLMEELLRIVAGVHVNQIQQPSERVLSAGEAATEEFQKVVSVFFSRFQEHLVFEVASNLSNNVFNSSNDNCVFVNILVAYTKSLVMASERVLFAFNAPARDGNEMFWSVKERLLRETIVSLLLQPLLHSYVICNDNLNLVSRLLPHTARLLGTLSSLCRSSEACRDANKLIFSSIPRRVPRMTSSEDSGQSGGWKIIKAVFEDTESTYTVSEEGMVYTSQSQSNTCGIVNVSFSGQQKAAWEFQLLSDTLGDECSLFGAARVPLTSRCYNNSPDLWMRRAYNGHMYCQGRSTTMNPPLERIHPGDIVRIEFDGKAKTISYSINGKELELGFSDINDTIYPSCGSYRQGVSIRLIKVEVFKAVQNFEEEEPSRDPTVINWTVALSENENRAPNNMLCMFAPKDASPVQNEKWLTAAADKGVEFGVHSWSFEFTERTRSPYAIGIVVGTTLDPSLRLANAALTLPFMELAWYSDGTLWCNGCKVAESFGMTQLPIERLSIITIRVDCTERTLSYFVDGEFVGVAFGPSGSSAAADFALPSQSQGLTIYPAASISSLSQTIRIMTSGFYGSAVLPFQLVLQKAAASVIGRLSAALLMGNPLDKKEVALLPLLQSSLLIGGIDERHAHANLNGSIRNHTSWKLLWDQCRANKTCGPLDDTPLSTDSTHDDSEADSFLQLVAESATTGEAAALLHWLQLINPEPAIQRIAFEKTGSYSFPSCEYPFLACLLKHSGLSGEALNAFRVLQSLPIDPKAPTSSPSEAGERPQPSSEMVFLWKIVQQFRRFLRGERQKLKSLAVSASDPKVIESLVSDAALANTTSESNSAAGETHDVALSTQTEKGSSIFVHDQEKLDLFYGNESNIAWIRQSGRAADSDCVTINAVGIDFDSRFVFVRFQLQGDYALSHVESSCSLLIDGSGTSLGLSLSTIESELLLIENRPGVIIGCLRFDIPALELFDRICSPSSEVHFDISRITTVPTRVLLQMPTNADIGSSPEDEQSSISDPKRESAIRHSLPPFADLCDRIEARVRFLLSMAVVNNSSGLELTDDQVAQSRNTDLFLRRLSSNPSTLLQKMRSHDGQEKWKRVIDFLRVHSQIRKQVSLERGDSISHADPLLGERSPLRIHGSLLSSHMNNSEDDMDDHGDDESASVVDCTMQTCYLFAITDGSSVSPSSLEEIITRRHHRALQRCFAMQALNTVINMADVLSDPFCLEEIILFVKPALATQTYTRSDKAAGRTTSVERIHYLVNLEGSPISVLMQVQRSFDQLFSGFASLVSQYTGSWDSLSQAACDTETNCNESSDSIMSTHSRGPIAIDSSNSHLTLGPLRMLLSLWTLNYSNRDHKFIMNSSLIPSLHKLLNFTTYERIVQTWHKAGLNLLEYYSEHMGRFKEKKKWVPWLSSYVNNKLESGGLSCRSVVLHLLLMPLSEISETERFNLGLENTFDSLCSTLGPTDISLLHHKVVSLINLKTDKEEKEKSKKDADEAAAKAKNDATMSARLSICGIFDEENKDGGITLSEYGRVASIRVEDSSSPEPGNVFATVCYDCDEGAQESGNYFELEILVLSGGDFGIGLADRETLSTDNALGSISGSYCYRGNTGQKIGASATPGSFPPFQEGDVIGCGFDMCNRTIFYTRNGELLGTAFDAIGETKLWPVVGCFGTTSTDLSHKVKINFGIEKYHYLGNDGDLVVGNIPTVICQRNALLERHLQETEKVAADTQATEASMAALSARGRRSRAPTVDLNINEVEELKLVTEEEYRATMDKLMTKLTAATAYLFEFSSLRAYAGAVLRFILVTVCDEEAAPSCLPVTNARAILSPNHQRHLIKERSTFGTPKFLTMEDGMLLREGLVAAVIHQLLLGGMYLSTAQNPLIDNELTIATLPMNKTLPLSNATIRSIQATKIDGMQASDGSENGRAVLEVLEVERVLYEYILALSTLLTLNKSLKHEISKSRSLGTLFLLMQHGSVRIKSVVATMLKKILPDISPAEAENSLSDNWKAELLKSDEAKGTLGPNNLGLASGARRQKRRIPDGVIRVLLLSVIEALSLGTNGKHDQPFGFGEMSLACADLNISLIQHLFESPMWTELLACNITDSLRSANGILDATKESTQPLDAEQEQTILSACAACAVLCGFGSLRPGCSVTGADGNKGTLISLNESEQQATVLFRSATSESLVDRVEKVSSTSLHAIRNCVNIDLTRLSQPLLPQLMALMKRLLDRMSTSPKINLTRGSSLLMRLNFVVANAVSTLLDRQTDLVIDATHDAKVIGDIIQTALLPTELPGFSSSQGLTRVWNHAQARLLERQMKEEETTTEDAASPQVTVGKAEDIEIVNVEPDQKPFILIEPSHAEERERECMPLSPIDPWRNIPLNYNPAARAQRLEAARSLMDSNPQLSARSVESVAQRLEYFMTDSQSAVMSLLQEPEVPGAQELESWVAEQSTASLPSQADYSSENLLSSVDNQNTDPSTSEVPCASLSSAPLCEMYVENISFHATTDAVYKGIPSNLPKGAFVLESDSEGPVTARTKRKRLGRTISEAVGKDVIVSFFDSSIGRSTVELVRISTLKVVTAFFDNKVSEVAEGRTALIYQLDKAAMILRMRRIAAKLLIEGNLSLSQGSLTTEDWLRFVKLTTISMTVNLDNKQHECSPGRSRVLTSLCSALIARSRTSLHPDSSGEMPPSHSSLENSVLSKLIKDVSDNFSTLTSSCVFLTSTKKSLSATASDQPASKEEDTIVCSSKHPFAPNRKTCGEIDIPSDWAGLMVTFHPKCSTPSNLASLNFYKSTKNFNEYNPSFFFFGPPSSFRPFVLTDVKRLYYAFSAGFASDHPLLGVVPLKGPVKIDSNAHFDGSASWNSISINEGTSPVGLGEDDTLFNLFDMGSSNGKSAEAPAVALADFEAIKSGRWFFETAIDSVPARGTRSSADRICLLGTSDTDEIGSGPNSFAITAAGEVIFCGEVVNQMGELGSWVCGDVIGCQFEVNDFEISAKFGKNGAWCEMFTGKIAYPESFPGLRVTFNVSPGLRISPNFGEMAFKHAPAAFTLTDSGESIPSWERLLARPMSDQAKMNEDAWGYHFCIKPLRDLHMRVTRGMELVVRLRPDEGLRAADQSEDISSVWIWRPKSSDDFVSLGDIATTDCNPPRGAVIVDKSQCAFPVSFKKVFAVPKLRDGSGVTVWRPIPPSADYVSLGDVIATNTSGTAPAKESVVCVPKWAVRESSLGSKLFKSKKAGADASKAHTASLWAVRGCIGTFFGSPADRSTPEDSSTLRSEDSEVKGVGKAYTLNYNVTNHVTGEWSDDKEVVSASSISWASELLDYLLENHATRQEVLKPATFTMLVKYITSNASPAPLLVVPLLIKMIRLAREHSVELPLAQIDPLCKAILRKANSKTTQGPASGMILSKALMGLVDLVVEAQSAKVAASAKKDISSLLPEQTSKETKTESSAASPDLIVSVADTTAAAASSSRALVAASCPWWDREGLIAPAVLESAAAVDLNNISCLFQRDPIIRKLRQALTFLAAMGVMPGFVSASPSVRSSDAPAATIDKLPVECPYPKVIAAKVWHDFASACAFAESEHPYSVPPLNSDGTFATLTRKISFPGAEKLRIMVDSRTCLGPGAQLSLLVGTVKMLVIGSSASIVLKASEVTVSFDVSGTLDTEGNRLLPSNPAGDWGWAIVVHATGPIYESSTATFALDSLPEVSVATGGNDAACLSAAPVAAPMASSVSSHVIPSTTIISEDTRSASMLPVLFEPRPPAPPSTRARSRGDSITASPEFIGATPSTAVGASHASEGARNSVMLTYDAPASSTALVLSPPQVTSAQTNLALQIATITDSFPPRPPIDSPRTSRHTPKCDSKTDDQKALDDRVIELVMIHGLSSHRGILGVPRASEVEVKINRPFPDNSSSSSASSSGVAEITRVLVVDYEVTSDGEELLETKCVKMLLPTTASQTIKVSVKASKIGYIVYSMHTDHLNALISIEAEAEAARSAAVSQDPGEVGVTEETKAEPAQPAMPDYPSEADVLDPSLWRCEQCTFVNPALAHVCEVCGYFHQGLAWSCTGCTFVNPHSNTR